MLGRDHSSEHASKALMISPPDRVHGHFRYQHLNAALLGVQSADLLYSAQNSRFERANVLPIFPLQQSRVVSRVVRQIASVATGRRHAFRTVTPECLGTSLMRQCEDCLAISMTCFSPSTLPVTFLEAADQLRCALDATFHSMVDYYPSLSLSRAQRDIAERLEYQALRRCSLLVYSSDWAARSAVAHYGIAKERVTVLPSGANLWRGIHEQTCCAGSSADRGQLRLLFVGKEWQRKGGDIALETARASAKCRAQSDADSRMPASSPGGWSYNGQDPWGTEYGSQRAAR